MKVTDSLEEGQVQFLTDIFSDGLHGREGLRHPGGRCHRRLGLRSGGQMAFAGALMLG
jgi:hypothetical protein